MSVLFLVAEQAEAGGGGLFNINLGVSAWTLIIFLALLAVLAKYAWRPILGALEERERRIQEALDAAARDRAEAERLLEEQRRVLAEARQQTQQILAEGRQAAERLRQEMLERTRAEQEELLAAARRDIEREREQAIEALRREAVDLSLAAASKLVQKRLDTEDDRKLVRDYLSRLAAGGVEAN
jgi:F-type H+-transporting ATPase subunit b